MIWYGMIWYDMVWYGMIRYGMVWYDIVIWYGMVWYGMVWYGMVWYGMELDVMVWYGMAYGMAPNTISLSGKVSQLHGLVFYQQKEVTVDFVRRVGFLSVLVSLGFLVEASFVECF